MSERPQNKAETKKQEIISPAFIYSKFILTTQTDTALSALADPETAC